MAESVAEPKNVFCHFCKKWQMQAGELECKHRMCARCYLDHSNKLDKCYICILDTAQVKRVAMKIVTCFENIDSDTVSKEEKFFCTNTNCEFIGNKREWMNHKPICDISKRGVVHGEKSTNTTSSVYAEKNTLRSSRFLEILKPVFDSAVSRAKGPLTVEDFRSLVFEAWEYTEDSFKEERTDVEIKTGQPEESTDSAKSVISDLVERVGENVKSGAEVAEAIAPKYSVEISDFVETDQSPSESFDSNRSTSELAATESNRSHAASVSLEWDLCADGGPFSSSTTRVDDPEEGDADAEPGKTEERFELLPPVRALDEVAPSTRPVEREIEQRRKPRWEALAYKLFTTRIPGRDSLGVNLVALLFGIVFIILNPSLLRRNLPKNVPMVNNPGETDGYITWRMENVTDLVARAQFNKRDMRLSQFINMRNYEVRLGVGSTFSADDNVVILWITAVVMKDDERPWPFEEMQLRLEHDNPKLVQTYDFKNDQRGQWREQRLSERKSVVYRQIQVETTKRMKYMRFTTYLTYDDAVAKGYIKDDQISVGFKLNPWGTSA